MANVLREAGVGESSLAMNKKLFFSILVLVSIVPGALAAGNEGVTVVRTEGGQLLVIPLAQGASTNVQTMPGVVSNDPKRSLE